MSDLPEKNSGLSSPHPDDGSSQDAQRYRKRSQPGSVLQSEEDEKTSTPQVDENDDGNYYRKRNQPGGDDKLEAASTKNVIIPPPLDDEETSKQAESEVEVQKKNPEAGSGVIKKLLFSLLLLGCALLGWVVLVDIIMLASIIITLPVWAQVIAGLLFLGATTIITVRLRRVIKRIRRSPLMVFDRARKAGELDHSCREQIRKSLEDQLSEIEKYPIGRKPELLKNVARLREEVDVTGSYGWFKDYKKCVHDELTESSKTKVKQIALLAGASAALSPWRALDVCVAFNACVECATAILKEFGVKPNPTVVLKFTLDSFVASFFAFGAEEASESFAGEVTKHITSELGKTLTDKVASKVGEGITVAFFVQRVGRRMLKQMEFPVS